MTDKQVKQAVVNTTIEKKGEEPESSREVLGEAKVFDSKPFSVSVSFGFTKNIGNFENIKGSVMLTVPTTEGDLEEDYKGGLEWVEDKVNSMILELDEHYKTED